MLRLDCVGGRGLVGAGVVSVVLAGSAPSVASVQGVTVPSASVPRSSVPRSSVPRSSAQWQASAPATRIHLDLRQRRISVIHNGERLGPWPVAIGDPKTPTPSGLFKVENMRINPQYESTKSGKVHPVTGPGGPLGHRWIGFLQQGDNQFGIHGTPWPHWVQIRAAVSNGCVRMLNAHVQQLYELVDVGTPVVITH